jgi:hypothetical protein
VLKLFKLFKPLFLLLCVALVPICSGAPLGRDVRGPVVQVDAH